MISTERPASGEGELNDALTKTLAVMAIWAVVALAIRHFQKRRRSVSGDAGDTSSDSPADSGGSHHGGWFSHGGDASHDSGGHGGGDGGSDGGGDGGGGD